MLSEIEYDQEHPRELIKCVLVGDTGVGKTRLICAQALGVGTPAPQVTQKQHLHFPTVFAIDQYHVSPEIRDRANFRVDGVDIALRLWDTFGDHEFNRKFAYQNAHVVVLCFAINSPNTFKNVNAVWYSEIKKYCPRTPIVLVGTQSDWRQHVKVSTSVTVSKSLSKRMRECSLVTPDMGRQVAKEIGATYYEASVVTMWGINHVFDNAVRAALNTRRHTRFWSSHLKGVLKPQLQPPYLPEKPDSPAVSVDLPSLYKENLARLLDLGTCADVEFLVQGQTIKAHRAILSAAAPAFAELFSAKELRVTNSGAPSKKLVLQDALVFGKPGSLPRGFAAISSRNNWISEERGASVLVTVDNFLSFGIFMHVLEFLYSGNIPLEVCTEELEEAARNLQIVHLAEYVANVINRMEYMNTEIYSDMVREMVSSAKKLVNSQIFSDIVFKIEDRVVVAHKAFLVAQCEMMAAMFMTGHFKESGVQVVSILFQMNGAILFFIMSTFPKFML